MADDDNVDAETLQAQIDLSMSLTHELVSSWIKPTKNRSYNQDLETELKEYMHRPPRLGVGAAIPESNTSMTRETARLKGHLVGKSHKRTREDDGEVKAESSSEEGENKANSIRKRVKYDPFAGVHGKKKKKATEDSRPTTAPVDVPKAGPSISKDSQSENANPFSIPKVKTSVPEVTLSVSNAGHDEPAQKVGSDKKETVSKGNTSTSPTSPKNSRLSVSVLNLDGPVGDDDSGDDETPASPSKKKRKRKKKKKQNHSVSEG